MTPEDGNRRISPLRTIGTFLRVGYCSEMMCNVLNRAYGCPLKVEEHAARPLAGGILRHGYQCGMIWGGALAAGAQAYRLLGPGSQAENAAINATRKMVDSFRNRNHDINCLELTETELRSALQVMKYFVKTGTVRCVRMAVNSAPAAFREINAALSEKPTETPLPPVSCAALLARRMGVSDFHQVMASGFAGGIGLSGGACGALGAAIWVLGIRNSQEKAGKAAHKGPQAVSAIEQFLKCTDYEFECCKIVGRKFESNAHHADHLRSGGCAKIIDVLSVL